MTVRILEGDALTLFDAMEAALIERGGAVGGQAECLPHLGQVEPQDEVAAVPRLLEDVKRDAAVVDRTIEV